MPIALTKVGSLEFPAQLVGNSTEEFSLSWQLCAACIALEKDLVSPEISCEAFPGREYFSSEERVTEQTCWPEGTRPQLRELPVTRLGSYTHDAPEVGPVGSYKTGLALSQSRVCFRRSFCLTRKNSL